MVRDRLENKYDWVVVAIYALLVLVGWVSIYAADYDPDVTGSIFNISQNSGKQLLFIASAGLLITGIYFIDAKLFDTFSWVFYAIFILLLIIVLLFGKEVAGSRSWFELGSFRLQPSEFTKFCTILALAKFLGPGRNLDDIKTLSLAAGIFLLPMGLILLQGDAGTALVFTSLIIVLYREGLSPLFIIAPLILLVIFLLTLLVNKTALISAVVILTLLGIGLSLRSIKQVGIIIGLAVLVIATVQSVDFVLSDVLKPHQQRRITLLVNPNVDPQGAGWNVMQSKIAIGSGGLTGKGFLNGTQTQFKFVPEQSTDFIFCTVGEEYGWLGTTAILALFAVLLLRVLMIADRQKSGFAKVYGYGVASILFFHFAINVSMTVGLFPVAGIPLPFLSYGGSSLWSFTIMLFVLLKFDANRAQILGRL
ncbi:MAG: rod shape-determining protein RodA [Bacteroidota bacterium]